MPRTLERIARIQLRPPARACYGRVSLALSDDDRMFEGSVRHYLECGASALTVLHAAATLAGIRAPGAILDFGAGAGRVTRWLRAHWPEARIAAADLRAQDLDFCAAEFGATTWLAGTDIAALQAPERYDLVWAGSVLTHLPEPAAVALLARMLSWCRPEGVVVASLHGRHVLGRGAEAEWYGVAEGWPGILRDAAGPGAYGYADYPGQPGYGIAACRPAWVAAQVEAMAGARLVLFGERLWDGHHDVVALQRQAAG